MALYGVDKGWAMTERGSGDLTRSATELHIGPSNLRWDGNSLIIDINEIGAPIPQRIRGQVRVHPKAVTSHPVALDGNGRHRWWPIAPESRVEVALDRPELRWHGNGYFDTNDGDEPLAAGFQRWDWSRAKLSRGSAVLYDATRRNGERVPLALRFDGKGGAEPFEPPARVGLPTTRVWRIRRGTQTDPGSQARIAETLEDTPFYARSNVAARILGEDIHAFHESLDLDRFDSRWVELLLPFRMPRRAKAD